MSATPKTPPRFVPTLTEVVHMPAPAAVAQPEMAAPLESWGPSIEERIIDRVMQRLDVSLERRLRDAVAAVVLEHTRALGPHLREEIESAVRQSVAETIAEQLAARAGERPAS